ncbi:MAG: HypC/HybG/HupF family hydrogenase formation chaperone, partial [Oscillospiraceae bacterium]|nr:HypC/HybG/HupF family hydrogenase formation chaperone [Oscillospiraceae bacterium]
FLHNPQLGDYVIAHAGFAIEKLNEEQALQNLKALQEVADAL